VDDWTRFTDLGLALMALAQETAETAALAIITVTLADLAWAIHQRLHGSKHHDN
jgi:hypothetical protein